MEIAIIVECYFRTMLAFALVATLAVLVGFGYLTVRDLIRYYKHGGQDR